ncbi:MAG: peptidase [Cyanothece sp. SIO1E1]|nr:peptidase [Cyanothece sp. SIO1E1]
MMKILASHLNRLLWLPVTLLTLGVSAEAGIAQQQQIYSPIPISSGKEITGSLSNKDIPTGMGGFSRDYMVKLKGGDQVAVDLLSDEFDALVALIGPDGSTIGENDDGPDGTTNSLLFARITEEGNYVVRVRSYAGEGVGEFSLKVTRLRPVND